MTTKKDEPGKDALRPSETAGGKKPVPTIDLKATEVTGAKSEAPASSSGKGAPEKGASGQTAPAAIASPASGAKPASETGAAKTGASASSAGAGTASGTTASASTPAASGKSPDSKSADAKNSNEKSSKSDKGGKPADTAAATAKARRSGGFLSHLTAGIVGGFLALLGADMLGPQIPPIADSLGLPSAAQKTSETTAEIESRLAALEQGARERSPAGDVTARLDAADSRIAALEELQKSVSAMQQAQADLTQKAAALDQQLQASSQGAAADDRIAKLEQQLDTLAAAAGDGTSALPELAALTGRLADLESTVNNQIAALRENVGKDVDERIAKIAETSESARAATQRMDRELASISTESARLGQRFEALKADDSRISESLRAVQEEAGALRSQLEAFSSDITQKVAKLTTTEDLSSAIAPVEEKVSNLQAEISGVVAAEQDRKANAQRIVLSLELANLKRAVDRGDGYADELAEVRKTSTGVLDLAALEAYESVGVATLAELQSTFRPVANDILDAAAVPEDGSVIDQLLAGARSVVRIRKVNYDVNDQSVEAIVGRINDALANGRLGDVLAEADKLPEPARQRAAEWRKSVEARHAVDQALTQVEDQLKASLSGAQAPSDANAN